MNELKQIQREKIVDNCAIGSQFAQLLVKGPDMSSPEMQDMMSNMLANNMMPDYGQEDPYFNEQVAGDLQQNRQGTILSNNDSSAKASVMSNLGNLMAKRQQTIRNMT